MKVNEFPQCVNKFHKKCKKRQCCKNYKKLPTKYEVIMAVQRYYLKNNETNVTMKDIKYTKVNQKCNIRLSHA